MIANIIVVVPCFRVKEKIIEVLNGIPKYVKYVICVDDKCPDNSGKYIEEFCLEDRVIVLYNKNNLGVGGATIVGFKKALDLGATIVVKIDGDGQMDPKLLPKFIVPILAEEADFTKGNRFNVPESLKSMPVPRIIGNAVLSVFSKFSTGYWNILDPTNGFLVLHRSTLEVLPLDKINTRYFFESDLLFRANIHQIVVVDIPMDSVYADEISNLSIKKIIGPFLYGHMKNSLKRIWYNYFVRGANFASLYFLLGPILFLGGGAYGIVKWIESSSTGVPATSGTVMLSALPVFIGFQLILAALAFDITNIPKRPLQKSADMYNKMKHLLLSYDHE